MVGGTRRAEMLEPAVAKSLCLATMLWQYSLARSQGNFTMLVYSFYVGNVTTSTQSKIECEEIRLIADYFAIG